MGSRSGSNGKQKRFKKSSEARPYELTISYSKFKTKIRRHPAEGRGLDARSAFIKAASPHQMPPVGGMACLGNFYFAFSRNFFKMNNF
jgi:hypothetical protein